MAQQKVENINYICERVDKSIHLRQLIIQIYPLIFNIIKQVQVVWMQEQKGKEAVDLSSWLFSKRLQFLGSQEEIIRRTDSYQISQDLFLSSKRNDPGPVGEIHNFQDLKEAYQIFNSLVFRCRFNAKNLEQTFTKSRNELRNKKYLKQIQKQCKNKIKKLFDILRIPVKMQEHWKTVLNYKNMIEHILKANVLLKSLLNKNFDLIKQGGADIKIATLSKRLQIQICLLIIDVVTLINTMKYMLVPFIQDDNNPSNSKVELQEKLALENALENANQSQQFDYLKSIDIPRFFGTIKRLVSQLEENQYAFKVWISIEEIRQRYIIDKYGVTFKKYHATAAPELMLYWCQVYNQHFNKAVQFKRQTIKLKEVFEDYQIMFNYFLLEAAKKPQQSAHVIQYLDLIQKVWVNIDLASASSLFWQELSLASEKITLPEDFAKNSRTFIMDIVNNIVHTFKSKKNEEFLEKLKGIVLSFSMDLLTLENDQDLTEHYFLKMVKQIRLLFTERNNLAQTIKDIEKTVSSNENTLDIINIVSNKIAAEAKNKSYFIDSKYEEDIIRELYETFQEDSHLIDEIKHFLLMARCLSSRTPSSKELEECLSFYSSQRRGIFTNQQRMSSDEVNRLRFGILDCIKNLTFQLVIQIKLNKPPGQLDRLKKIIYKLLKIYESKRNAHLRNSENIQDEDEQQQNQINSLLLRRTSSVDIDANWFQVEAEDLQGPENQDENDDDFTMNYMKKLFELRVEMILKSIHDLELQELPYRQEFINIKGRIYSYAANSEKSLLLRQDVKLLPQLQLDFVKERYFEAWNGLRKLKDIEGVNTILEKAWDGKRNLLKLFVIIYQKYKQPIFQSIMRGKDLEEKLIQTLIDDSLECQHKNMKIDSKLRQNLINSIRILDSIEKVSQLKKQLVEQDEQLSNIEEAKNFKSIKQEAKFKQIDDKLEIFAIMKNDVITMRKYIIKLEPVQIQEIYKKLRKLTQFNRNISLETNKQKDTIIMKVDQIQNTFESYPKLVKFLIETYLQLMEFCHKQLNFELYPLMLHNHFKIYKKNEHNLILKMNPYEGILLNAILPYKQLKIANIYRYPRYPFIQLADQLSKKFERDKVYDFRSANKAEYYAFQHLIEEMKALSMEMEGSNIEKAKAILKCPYFWSSADKLFQIVEFKERYQSIVNIEESRRKQNQKIRESLSAEEKQAFTYWPPEKKHPNYKPAYGYNKTNQVYFSIEGLLQKQAFEQDIGNFKGNDIKQKYKFHGYAWSKDKTQIERLVKMVAEREKKKGSNTSFYDKTFNSFQNQIRNLRNLSVHYIYDTDQKRQIDLEDKLEIFETYFPKLFVFLYRWRPFLGKDYINDIKAEKISFLKQLFCKQDNSEIITRLSNIKELSTYNIRNNNSKNYLLELFNYDFAKVNSCEPCKILCNSLRKQASFWGFLEDVKRQNYKEGKDMTYNLLFWDHDKKGCNGMVNIIFPYFNVTQRNQFTTEQFAHVKNSLMMMKIEKERLEKAIKKKQLKRAELRRRNNSAEIEQEDNSPGSDSEGVEAQNKNREPVQNRFKKLTARQLDSLYDELARFDYVCKYFIYQLEMQFPYLFYDLRKERYQWDERAWQYPKKE